MSTPLTETIAAIARAELARRNISRTAAAQALGISRTLMWSRLRGEKPFTIVELETLAKLLDLPISVFMPTEERAA